MQKIERECFECAFELGVSAIGDKRPGVFKVNVELEQVDENVVVRVRDQGPGIPQNELESIFERFYRGSRVRDLVPGTGMGLNVARDIINAHQGQLTVENRPEGGTQFSFSLPIFNEDTRE